MMKSCTLSYCLLFLWSPFCVAEVTTQNGGFRFQEPIIESHPFFDALQKKAETLFAGGRSKRQATLLPRGMAIGTKWAINFPGIKGKHIKSGYDLDFVANIPLPDLELAGRKKRHITYVNDTFSDLQGEKLGIFQYLESLIKRTSHPSRDCLLRAVCEVAQTPFVDGVFGDVLNIMFRPSVTSVQGRSMRTRQTQPQANSVYLDTEDQFYQELLEAEVHGEIKGKCFQKYSKCFVSFFDVIPLVKHWIFD